MKLQEREWVDAVITDSSLSVSCHDEQGATWIWCNMDLALADGAAVFTGYGLWDESEIDAIDLHNIGNYMFSEDLPERMYELAAYFTDRALCNEFSQSEVIHLTSEDYSLWRQDDDEDLAWLVQANDNPLQLTELERVNAIVDKGSLSIAYRFGNDCWHFWKGPAASRIYICGRADMTPEKWDEVDHYNAEHYAPKKAQDMPDTMQAWVDALVDVQVDMRSVEKYILNVNHWEYEFFTKEKRAWLYEAVGK